MGNSTIENVCIIIIIDAGAHVVSSWDVNRLQNMGDCIITVNPTCAKRFTDLLTSAGSTQCISFNGIPSWKM